MVFTCGKCTSTARLDGKTAIITGCNTGIGKETVKDFYLRGARIVMACRSLEKANETAEDIKEKYKGKESLGEIVVTQLNLSNLDSVRTCANHILETEKRIDLLINNAGVMLCPKSLTDDGFEMQFGTNHLGHFLFTLLLLPKIIASAPARIVNVSSLAHERGVLDFDDLNFEKKSYSATQAYQQSKLANVVFTKELAKRLEAAGIQDVTVYSLHPGVIKTDLSRHMSNTLFPGATWIWNNIAGVFIKNPEEGAQTTIYCAVDEACAKENGLYYSDCKVKEPSKEAKNEENQKKLWEVSLKLVGLPEDFNPIKK